MWTRSAKRQKAERSDLTKKEPRNHAVIIGDCGLTEPALGTSHKSGISQRRSGEQGVGVVQKSGADERCSGCVTAGD
jgi:hypothetical protein